MPKHTKSPFYIGDSFQVVALWVANFAANLPSVSMKYSIPAALQAAVLANGEVVKTMDTYETLINQWLGSWRTLRKSLFNANPGVPAPEPFPGQPNFPITPDPGGAYILTPFIQAASIILASPMVTEGDIQLLGLVRAKGKPVPPEVRHRGSAESHNYPLMQGEVVNGKVVIRIIRGNRFKKMSALLQVDKAGLGHFVTETVTTAMTYSMPAILQEGVSAAAWVFRAIYVEGPVQVSDWSPVLLVGMMAEPVPTTTASRAESMLRGLLKDASLAPAERRREKAPTNGNGAEKVV